MSPQVQSDAILQQIIVPAVQRIEENQSSFRDDVKALCVDMAEVKTKVAEHTKILDEINKVKWVKGGKFVKIKDRCAKYNNKPWCSQGAIDNPLELSDTVFENIEKISKKTGLSEENILNKIK